MPDGFWKDTLDLAAKIALCILSAWLALYLVVAVYVVLLNAMMSAQ